jgi:aryl-alcohol dehydrogenase-like predicted oxidoreductase
MTTFGSIGLGTFPFSGIFREVSESTAHSVVDTFLARGGSYIETAPSYPRRIDLGAILSRYPRNKLAIATKCVTGFDESGNRTRSGKRDFILRQVEDEIKRLRCDYIDLLQSHITPEDVSITEFLDTIEVLFERGLIRSFGASNVDTFQLTQLNQTGRVEWVQNRLSVIHRVSYESIKEYCLLQQIKLNVYQVLERGQLLSDFSVERGLSAADLRRSKPEYAGDANKVIREWFCAVSGRLQREHGVRPDALATRWALAQPRVQLCVVGATLPEQIENALAAAEPLPPAASEQVDGEYRNLQSDIRSRFGLSVEEFRGLA